MVRKGIESSHPAHSIFSRELFKILTNGNKEVQLKRMTRDNEGDSPSYFQPQIDLHIPNFQGLIKGHLKRQKIRILPQGPHKFLIYSN